VEDRVAHDSLYAAPRSVADPAECYFYHTLDLPHFGVLPGDWDLRAGIEPYLGGVDFRGRRVLDVGTATGFLTFAMEQRGAEVVAFDLSPAHRGDIVPTGPDSVRTAADLAGHIAKVNKSYWLAHGAWQSRSRMVYGTVYRIPAEIGPVDTSIFGAILLHLRDPILALQNALRLTENRVIVVEALWGYRRWWAHRIATRLVGPHLGFIPNVGDSNRLTWWRLDPSIIRKILAVLGFARSTVSFHKQPFLGKPRLMFTVVAERTQPRYDFGLDGE
jgi:SAM-dependent methyltransferase